MAGVRQRSLEVALQSIKTPDEDSMAKKAKKAAKATKKAAKKTKKAAKKK
ncbi:hypothetical protein ACQR10_14045 [Bradyrhizobium sp. HKCCYLRH2060]|nr:hypothetical protein [Bradyrhizobium sp. SZCCHNR3003]